jgi:hypothetical protein
MVGGGCRARPNAAARSVCRRRRPARLSLAQPLLIPSPRQTSGHSLVAQPCRRSTSANSAGWPGGRWDGAGRSAGTRCCARQPAGGGGGHHQPQPPIRFSAARPHGSAASCTGSFRVPLITTTSSRPSHPAPRTPYNRLSLLAKKCPRPLTTPNRHSQACLRRTLTPNHFPRRALHQGCVAGPNDGEEGSGGVVADIAKLSVAGRPTTPVSWPPTTRRTCPVTVSPQAGGTALAPPAWGWRAKYRWPGSRRCSRAATPPLASCLAVRMVATPSRS